MRTGQGVEALAVAIEGFIAWLDDTGRSEIRVADRLHTHVLRIVQARLLDHCVEVARVEGLDLREMARGSLTPDEAADRIMEASFGKKYCICASGCRKNSHLAYPKDRSIEVAKGPIPFYLFTVTRTTPAITIPRRRAGKGNRFAEE